MDINFILSLNVVSVSVVYAVRMDGIKFSVRSECREIDAGRLTQKTLKGYGSGGGHQAMAGGFIPAKNLKKMSPDLDQLVEKGFLNQIHQMQGQKSGI